MKRSRGLGGGGEVAALGVVWGFQTVQACPRERETCVSDYYRGPPVIFFYRKAAWPKDSFTKSVREKSKGTVEWKRSSLLRWPFCTANSPPPLNRKRRERALPRGAYQTLKRQILEDLEKIQAVPVSFELIQRSLELLQSHPLKTLDSLYLAGALGLEKDLKEPLLFVSSDRQLLQAAQAEGLPVLNPEIAP